MEDDLGIDFGMGDFDLGDLGMDFTTQQGPKTMCRGIPKVQRPQVVSYKKALDFAEGIDLVSCPRYFALVSGQFVFGDLLEALVERRKVGIRKLRLCTLSLSEENIDSLVNVADACMDDCDLVLSAYWWANERSGLVPYLEKELGDACRLRVAYANVHAKLAAVETPAGNHVCITGSANLRSCNCVEHVNVERGEELYAAVYDSLGGIMDEFEAFQTEGRTRPLRGLRTWHAAARGLA